MIIMNINLDNVRIYVWSHLCADVESMYMRIINEGILHNHTRYFVHYNIIFYLCPCVRVSSWLDTRTMTTRRIDEIKTKIK